MPPSEPTIVARFTGSGNAKTRPFNVPEGNRFFIVRWTTRDEMPLIYVHHLGDGEVDSVGGSGGESGESAVYATGDFYIEMTVDGGWQIEAVLE